MTIESQRINNARYEELTRLAKENVCRCGGELIVIRRALAWKFRCWTCGKISNRYAIKSRPTRAEETKERIAKMELAAEEAAKNPPKRDYNIDDLWRG